jgi:hypothetical protein
VDSLKTFMYACKAMLSGCVTVIFKSTKHRLA